MASLDAVKILRNIRRIALAVAAATMLVSPAAAQQKLIKLIAPFEAGSAADLYARVVAPALGRDLGSSIVIENRPGAIGTLGATAFLREPADGATLLVGTAGLLEIAPLLFDNLTWTIADFAPLIKGVESPLVLVAQQSIGVESLDQFVHWAKANPGKLSYASYGSGTPAHFLGVKLNEVFGLDLSHVPHRGSASQTQALIMGEPAVGFSQTQNALPYVESGVLKPIAVSSQQRFRLMPKVPTFRELGHPDLSAGVWYGLFARSGTPQPLLDRFVKAAKAAHSDSAVQSALLSQGYEIPAQTGTDFARSIAEGRQRWQAIIKKSGFKLGR